jgi:hypothetical protein
MPIHLPSSSSAGPLVERPLETMQAEMVRGVHTLWLSVKGERAMPERGDLSARLLKNYLPHLFLFEVLGPQHCVVRLSGTAVTSVLGSDTTGNQLTPAKEDELTRRTLRVIDRVVATREPVLIYSERGAAVGMQAHSIESLSLPLSRNGRDVHFVLWIAEIKLLPEIAKSLSLTGT